MRRLATMLAVVGVLCFGSGLSRFVHVMAEHGGGEGTARSYCCAESPAPDSSSPGNTPDRDDQRCTDCATCQMLGQMTASASEPAPDVGAPPVLPDHARVPDENAPKAPLPGRKSARAPPFAS